MQQTEITIIGEVPQVVDLPVQNVALCGHFAAAICLCITQARVKRHDSEWAELLGMPKSSFSAIINYDPNKTNPDGTKPRKRNLDGNQINVLQRAAGNRAISQWLGLDLAGQCNHQTTATLKADLIARLAEMEEAERKELAAG